MHKVFVFLFALLLSVSVFAQAEKPAEASVILEKAFTTAKQSKKQVLLVYHASWCKWCRKLDSALTSTELKPVVDNYFVLTHLDVNERKEKVELLENPGAKELLKQHGGEQAGLPYYAVLNAKGTLLENSKQMPDKSNIGYPGAPDEIKLFVGMLKKANKQIKKQDLKLIEDYLTKHAPH